MEDFSMFEHALKVAKSHQKVEDLGGVGSVSRRTFEERKTFRFRAQAPCLEYLNLLIENWLLLRTNRAGRIYAGFQKLSFMKGVLDRYLRIADLSERLYIFGEPDWKAPRHPNMKHIPLTHDVALAKECFLVADSPVLTIALVSLDEEGSDSPNLDSRYFRAFKSSDAVIVRRLSAAAEELIDQSLAA